MDMIIVVPHDGGAECCGRNASGRKSVYLSGVLVRGQTGFVMNEEQFRHFYQSVQRVPAAYGVVLADFPDSWHYATLEELRLLYLRIAPTEINVSSVPGGSFNI
jgi:hypothetical protein